MGFVPWQATVTNETKQVVPNPVITVRNVSDDTLATLYSDAAGTAEVNPITGDANGFVQFWAQAGEYYIDGAKGGDVAERWYWDAVDLGVTQPYASRADAVAAWANRTSDVRRVSWVTSGGVIAVVESSGATVIPDMDDAIPDGYATPEHFGAVGDGVTDDSAAIYAMFAAGGDMRGFGGSTYLMSYTAFFVSNSVFDGNGCTIFNDPLHPDACAFLPVTYQEANNTNWVENVTFKNFTLNTATDGGNGIGLSKSRNVLISGLRTTQMFWHLVDGAGAHELIVENCFAKNMTTASAPFQVDTLSASGGARAVNSSGVMTESAFNTDVVSNTWNRSVNVIFRNLVIKDCVRGVHLHRSGGHNIKVHGCQFDGCDVGILGDDVTRWFEVDISGNTFVNCGYAVDVRNDIIGLVVSNNTVYGGSRTTSYGLFFPQSSGGSRSNWSISGNVVKLCWKGLAADYVDGITISGNGFSLCGDTPADSASALTAVSYAASTFRCDGVNVIGNVFDDCQDACIKVKGTSSNDSVGVNIQGNNGTNSETLIVAEYVFAPNIGGNTLRSSGSLFYGIIVKDCERGSVWSNHVDADTLGAIGIWLRSNSVIHSHNNRIQGSATPAAGICVDGGGAEFISTNLVDGGYSLAQIYCRNSAVVTYHEPFESVSQDGSCTLTAA